MIRVLLVDDHLMVREGLRLFLNAADDIEVVGEAETVEGALDACAHKPIDLVLMDLVLGQGGDGIDAIECLRREYPKCKVIALSSFTEPERMMRLLKSGAHGFLQKSVHPQELLASIRQVMAGTVVLDPVALRNLHRQEEQIKPSGQSALTAREFEVLRLICRGYSNKEIGAELYIAEKTVKVHVSHILAKLHVYDRSGAIIAAVHAGLLTL